MIGPWRYLTGSRRASRNLWLTMQRANLLRMVRTMLDRAA